MVIDCLLKPLTKYVYLKVKFHIWFLIYIICATSGILFAIYCLKMYLLQFILVFQGLKSHIDDVEVSKAYKNHVSNMVHEVSQG